MTEDLTIESRRCYRVSTLFQFQTLFRFALWCTFKRLPFPCSPNSSRSPCQPTTVTPLRSITSRRVAPYHPVSLVPAPTAAPSFYQHQVSRQKRFDSYGSPCECVGYPQVETCVFSEVQALACLFVPCILF